MSSTAALRDLYEALDMLDAQQTGRQSDRGLDLRDTCATPPGRLPPEP